MLPLIVDVQNGRIIITSGGGQIAYRRLSVLFKQEQNKGSQSKRNR